MPAAVERWPCVLAEGLLCVQDLIQEGRSLSGADDEVVHELLHVTSINTHRCRCLTVLRPSQSPREGACV